MPRSAVLLLGIALLAMGVMGCTDEPAWQPPVTMLADHIPQPAHNQWQAQTVALGRMLFYDPILSSDSVISCASCHRQALAFTDGQVRSSAGKSGQLLPRHTPSLVNMAWMDGLFWDGGARNLESVSVGPIAHADEMALPLPEMVSRLQRHPRYPALFLKAFGTDSIQVAYVLRALAQFQRTLISDQSAYDRWVAQQPGATLGQEALKGMALFSQYCAGCHPPPFFTDHRYHHNGLDSIFPVTWEHPGQGRYRVTLLPEDLGRYKTPTLRNIAVTAPYMHDGRFQSLEEVMAHYRHGVKAHANTDERLIGSLDITPEGQQQLIAFLHTLTDSSFLEDRKFANPFQQDKK
jgi:cytochrome c peroxidase